MQRDGVYMYYLEGNQQSSYPPLGNLDLDGRGD
jgi:hypothetical protein